MSTLFDELTHPHHPLSPTPHLPPPTRTPSRRPPTKKTPHYRAATTLLDHFHHTLFASITAAHHAHPSCPALAALHADAEDLLNAKGDRCFIYKAGEHVAYDADLDLLRREIEGVRYAWEVVLVEGFGGAGGDGARG